MIAGLVAAGFFAARQVYFLGTDEGGRLALYRGLPYDLPLRHRALHGGHLLADARRDSLPEDRRDEATGHDLRSRDDAVDLLDDLETGRGGHGDRARHDDSAEQQRQRNNNASNNAQNKKTATDGTTSGQEDRKKKRSGGGG